MVGACINSDGGNLIKCDGDGEHKRNIFMKSKIFHSIMGNQRSKVVSCLINAGVVDYLQVPLLQTLVPMTTNNQQLEQQLEQSKATLGKMETNRTNEIVDNIFDIMLAADEDQDFFLSDGEIDTMIFKIKGIMNVEVNDAAFKEKVIENGRDLDSIMLLLKDFFDPNYGGEKVIRVLD